MSIQAMRHTAALPSCEPAVDSADTRLFATTLRSAIDGTASESQRDFTQMTRQELMGWVNDEIRGGRMSLDESTPFLSMTFRMLVVVPPIDLAMDGTRFNFLEQARAGVDSALSVGDRPAAQRFEHAFNLLNRQQAAQLDLQA
jgi:hypothetical protein